MDDGVMRRLAGVWTLIGLLLLAWAALHLLREPLALVVPPLGLAAVVVYLCNPLVAGLHRLRVPRPVGTILTYLLVAAALTLVGVLAGPVLVEQSRGLAERLPDIAAATETSVNAQLARFGLPGNLRLDLEGAGIAEAVRGVVNGDGDEVLGLLRGAGTVVGWVAHLALTLVLGPILAFYALADLPRISRGIERLVPPGRRGEVVDVFRRITRLVGAYFRGQLLVATFVGTATVIGLWLVGLPFWALVGIVTGVFNLVPLVGPTAGGAIGVLVALTVGDGLEQALLVLVVMVAVQQVDNHLITPVVVSRSVSVHPITVILALVVAGSLGGIPLMFVAIPAVAALKLVVVHVLVTRVPAMQHLAGEAGELPDLQGNTLGALALELRRAWERRTGGGTPDPDADAGPPGDRVGTVGQDPGSSGASTGVGAGDRS